MNYVFNPGCDDGAVRPHRLKHIERSQNAQFYAPT